MTSAGEVCLAAGELSAAEVRAAEAAARAAEAATRAAEVAGKLARVRGWLDDSGYGAALFSSQPGVAWVTAGLEDRVVRNEEPALVWALVTGTGAFLITTNIERPRLAAEEDCTEFELHAVPWYSPGGLAEAAESLADGPSSVLTPAGFSNALTVLAAVGGSTNAVIHLCAVAGRRGIPLPLRQFAEVSARVPVIADVAPIGTGLMPDLARAGGVPAVLAAVASHLDLSVPVATGAALGESLRSGPVRWPLGEPVTALPAFMVVHGNLAPDGAVIKAAAASPALPEGCDYDFLQASTPDKLAFAEPVIGRS